MKKNLRSKRIAAAAVMVLFIVAVFARCGMSPSSKGNINEEKVSSDDIAQGVSAVEEISDRDVDEAEKKLDYYWKSQQVEFYNSGNYEALFKGCMIMGDSHAEGFASYGLLPESMVAATVGKDVNNNDEDRKKVLAAKPGTIFFVYGQNTLQRSNGNAEKAAEKYGEFLTEMKKQLPDTRFVVCSVFMPEQSVIAEKPGLANIPQMNEALKKLCDDNGWTYIDTNPLLTEQYYEPDHIHTNKAFHKLWLSYAASETGLLSLEG